MSYINIIKIFKMRNLLFQITNEKILKKILKNNYINFYCGFDPTSSSLHIGHLLPLISIKRFQKLGHKPILLIGESTGLIGDPSFKKNERKLQNKIKIKKYTKKIIFQINSILNKNKNNNLIILNNYKWFKNINIINFLEKIGKHFFINNMINKEIIKNRIKNINKNISFTEFSYILLQSYDFLHLYNKYKVFLQIGGSDQWGNIISGINLIKKINKNKVFGLTLPLLIQSNGIKFGKTEKNTIWLDEKKTSPYKFYQFWINTKDSDVYNFLKLFTFINIAKIYKIKKQDKNKKKPIAQTILADKLTYLIHGKNNLISAKRITKSLFNNKLSEMTEYDFYQLKQDGIFTIKINFNNIKYLQEILLISNLSSSYNKAKNMIISKSIKVNGKIESNIYFKFKKKNLIFKKYSLICRGKKNYCLIYWNNSKI
ncbi:Tyrosine--tRNA ligase [Candidatus Annandia adelgestsuga]|uniref:Tyrosine--tRNA ligase n=1 Tax=Candidatus Annandia adelgestsuga TaxID=1302411 RepID=A0A3Q9CM32_9ENTR|nr:tyrosine--tRNA ligase [Candidatus Annandia adelgestsuga]AZP36375.1 Tyrosine--tRNA ligase [Candidatus Annandia adelgestsuga]